MIENFDIFFNTDNYESNNLTQTASCKYGLKVALDSIKSRGRRDYGARYYNSLLFN